jgi:DNA primase
MSSGRIPDSFIQELLARSDIVELIGSRLELHRAGREYKARSPFTNEKTPSFFVSPAKQMYFDFSSGKNGNAISFLMEYDRLSFVDAVEELARRAGLTVPREGGTAAMIVLDGPLDALALAERFYRAQLRTHQPAIDYLKKRGVTGETAKRFGIGYAPDSWDALTRQFPDPKHAVTAGLLIERDSHGGVYDRFRNRIMFPIRDTRGRVIAFGGRTLANDPAKYLNSPETPLFHKGRNLFGLYEAKQASKAELPYLLVVEGYMDVVMMAQYGITPVVATLGTATTREHLTLLFKSTSKVVFCFDGDDAGRRAAWKALDQVLPELYEGRECRFMFLPEGHDPDTLVQEIGTEAYVQRIETALPLSEFLLGELMRRVDTASREGRARLVALAQPYIARLREGPLRAVILEDLARRARLGRDDLEASMRASAPRPRETTETATETAAAIELSPLVRRALKLLLDRADIALQAANIESLLQSRQAGVDILVAAIEFFASDPTLSLAQLIEAWRGTPQGGLVEKLAVERPELDDAGIEREFLDVLAQLRQRAARNRVQELLQCAQERALAPAEREELENLTRQLSRRSLV